MLEQQFLNKCKELYSDEEYQMIVYALDFAKESHSGQKRRSGEDYIIHPIHAAKILLDYGLDVSSICAAILHDVVEDTSITAEGLKKKFGEDISHLVEGVTKLSQIKFSSKVEEQAENYKKLFFSIANDSRVLFIKLADRLHNMRTLYALPEEKQIRIATETLEIYAPIASRLGFSKIKSELEDLCFKYLYKEDFESLSEVIEGKRNEFMVFANRIMDRLNQELVSIGINADIKGRPKHLYSIYKKIKNQGKTLDQIYDLIAVRIIVDNERECYTVLGLVHSLWKPIPGRFKDYIAMPKPNNYQSLHTTVVSDFGQIFEIQIRTFEMNRVAEYGVAAHWKYKEGRQEKTLTDFDKKIGWIQEMLDSDKDIKDNEEFIDALRVNIAPEEIYVFTPKGDVMNLPENSTPVDFAYKVHSDIGNICVGAKINGKIVPLNTILNTGDVVEILTNKGSKGPSRDWLKFVRTPQAKTRIKVFFKKITQTDNIKTGKEMLEREAKRRGFSLTDLLSIKDSTDDIFKRYSLVSLDDLYASIGYGSMSTNQILSKLIDRYKKFQAKVDSLDLAKEVMSSNEKEKKKSTSGILIEGYDGFLVHLSKCCNPVPGDSIIGYAARGTGISIHRVDCSNIKGMEPERILDAKWANTELSVYNAHLRLECYDRAGLINSFIPMLAVKGISITSMEIRKKQQDKTVISLTLQIREASELEYVINKLKEFPEVILVKRGN